MKMKKLLVLLLVVAVTAMFCLTSCSEMKDPVSGLDDKMEAGIEKGERIPAIVGVLAVAGLASYSTSCVVANLDGNKYFRAYGVVSTAVSFARYANKATSANFVSLVGGIAGSTTCQKLWSTIETKLEESESNRDDICEETADGPAKGRLKGTYDVRLYYNGQWYVKTYYGGTEIRFSDYDTSTNHFNWCTVYYNGGWRNCYIDSQTYNSIHRGKLYQVLTLEY